MFRVHPPTGVMTPCAMATSRQWRTAWPRRHLVDELLKVVAKVVHKATWNAI